MLKIRFTRIGRKHDPTFRIVLTDSRKAPRSGAYIEKLGFYNPTKKGDFSVDGERVKHWISQGAQVSPSVFNLLVSEKIVEGKKVDVSAKSKKKVAEEPKEQSVESTEYKKDDSTSDDKAEEEVEEKPEETKEK